MATDRWGIDDRYHDIDGVGHDITLLTRTAIRAAMGVSPTLDADDDDDEPEASPAVRVVGPNDSRALGPGAVYALTLEDGTALTVRDHLPPDTAVGFTP